MLLVLKLYLNNKQNYHFRSKVWGWLDLLFMYLLLNKTAFFDQMQ